MVTFKLLIEKEHELVMKMESLILFYDGHSKCAVFDDYPTIVC